MTDRKLTVKRQGPVFELEGVAYVADKPNANGLVYPEAVLREAVAKFQKGACYLTLGCQFNPRPGDIVGTIESVEYEDGAVRATAITCNTEAMSKLSPLLEALTSDPPTVELAFAGTCEGTVSKDERTIEKMNITALGIVPIRDVEPPESSDT